MLTNLIMRGVIKGEEWVAGHFISAHIQLPCGTVLSLPETLTHTYTYLHTHTHTYIWSRISFRGEPISHLPQTNWVAQLVVANCKALMLQF